MNYKSFFELISRRKWRRWGGSLPVRRKFASEEEVCRWGESLPVRTEVCRWVHRDWWWADRCCLHRRRGLHLFASRSDSHIACFSCNQGRPFRSRCCFNVLKIEPRRSFPHASWESPLLIFHKIQNGQQHNQQQLFCLLQRPNDQQAPQQIIDWNKLAIKCKCRLTVPVAASLCGVVLVPSWIYFLYHCVAFIAKLFYPQPASSTIVSHAILGFHIGPVDFCNGLLAYAQADVFLVHRPVVQHCVLETSLGRVSGLKGPQKWKNTTKTLLEPLRDILAKVRL